MKIFILTTLFLFSIYGFSQGEYAYGVVTNEEATVYEKPDFSSKKLFSLKKKDSLKVFDFYKGKPFTKVLFWKVKIDNKIGYVSEGYLKSMDLIKLKNNIEEEKNNQNKKIEKEKEKGKPCEYSKNEIDEFNGTQKLFTKFYKISEYELRFQLRKYDTQAYLVAESYRDLGCSTSFKNDKSFVKIKLENGKIITVFHSGDTDCGNFRVFGKITPTEIKDLKKSAIKIVRLSGTDSYMDLENTSFPDFFVKKLSCLEL